MPAVTRHAAEEVRARMYDLSQGQMAIIKEPGHYSGHCVLRTFDRVVSLVDGTCWPTKSQVEVLILPVGVEITLTQGEV